MRMRLNLFPPKEILRARKQIVNSDLACRFCGLKEHAKTMKHLVDQCMGLMNESSCHMGKLIEEAKSPPIDKWWYTIPLGEKPALIFTIIRLIMEIFS